MDSVNNTATLYVLFICWICSLNNDLAVCYFVFIDPELDHPGPVPEPG
jgi:hypothetical protein